MYHSPVMTPEIDRAYDVFVNIWLGERAPCDLYIPILDSLMSGCVVVRKGATVRRTHCYLMAMAFSDAEGNICLPNLTRRPLRPSPI